MLLLYVVGLGVDGMWMDNGWLSEGHGKFIKKTGHWRNEHEKQKLKKK